MIKKKIEICTKFCSKLDPILPESEVFELVRISLDCYVPLPPGGVKKGKDETYEDHLESEAAMKATEEAIQDLLSQIILKDPTPHGLESVFKVTDNLLLGAVKLFRLGGCV